MDSSACIPMINLFFRDWERREKKSGMEGREYVASKLNGGTVREKRMRERESERKKWGRRGSPPPPFIPQPLSAVIR
ncbi:hypothetical protein CEXT_90341 [Caerostris extrusa]|uniref:Uncharacterized protein n=1 Tax=Caerostris extrusa TaxID=172846 RepID=A0AAV4Y4B2_CAEEX|nr:hypothetical protein CEXT_90341 [Caerostris extrusa]